MADNLSIDALRGSGTPLLAKMALGMISRELSSDPKARTALIRDPTDSSSNITVLRPAPTKSSFSEAWLNFTRSETVAGTNVAAHATLEALGGVDTYLIHKTIAARVMTARHPKP